MERKTDDKNAQPGATPEFCEKLSEKLRTPLNAIIGFAELLSLRPANYRHTGDVQQILRSARDLLQVIESELGGSAPGMRMLPGGEEEAPACDVLYIEDDMVNFTLVARILEFRPELKVLHATHGAAGLEMARSLQPKLILLDLNLPDMHGSDVLQALQLQGSTRDIAVVVLSADATSSQIERLLGAGARNYLTKPFDIDPFLALVDEYTAPAAAVAAA